MSDYLHLGKIRQSMIAGFLVKLKMGQFWVYYATYVSQNAFRKQRNNSERRFGALHASLKQTCRWIEISLLFARLNGVGVDWIMLSEVLIASNRYRYKPYHSTEDCIYVLIICSSIINLNPMLLILSFFKMTRITMIVVIQRQGAVNLFFLKIKEISLVIDL